MSMCVCARATLFICLSVCLCCCCFLIWFHCCFFRVAADVGRAEPAGNGGGGGRRRGGLNMRQSSHIKVRIASSTVLVIAADCSQEWLSEKRRRGKTAEYVQDAGHFRAVSASETDYLLGTHFVRPFILGLNPLPPPPPFSVPHIILLDMCVCSSVIQSQCTFRPTLNFIKGDVKMKFIY